MILGQETLGFRRTGFSPVLSLLTPAFSLPDAPQLLARLLQGIGNAPLPLFRVRGFGTMLSPVIFTARGNSTSELLRFL
jgi:hypothetical protein